MRKLIIQCLDFEKSFVRKSLMTIIVFLCHLGILHVLASNSYVFDTMLVRDKQALLYSSTSLDGVVKGKVLDAKNGAPLPGVSVVIKGSSFGTSTNSNGEFSIEAKNGDVLLFSFMGMVSQEHIIKDTKLIEIQMKADALLVEEIVVTALGISRDKKSLGYAISKVEGDDVNRVKTVNVLSGLNGRVSGVNISSSYGFGGSSNIIIRGGASISGSNQALFVVDGIVISNTSLTNRNTLRGGFQGGYDYGNFASDLNPEDIESVSILKGASATALYGSRGSNGVVIIKTKQGKVRKGIGVSINSSVNFETINKNTLPNYQNEYGAGYSTGFDEYITASGEEQKVVKYYDDASWGSRFDPNLMVRHWDSWDPSDVENYGKTRPWVAPDNLDEFFRTGVMWVNNIALEGGGEKSTYRLSYTNTDQTGTLPNQNLSRNNYNFNGSFKLNERLSAQINAQYNLTELKGRPGLGYSSVNSLSFMGSMMWHQRNLDFKRLRNYKTPSGEQKSWNRYSISDPIPTFWDNPYWTRYENYQNDSRHRIVGAIRLNYKLYNWLSLSFKATTDHFDFLNEERIAKGGKGTSDYTKDIRLETENNLQATLNLEKRFGENFHLTGIAGWEQRTNKYDGSILSTVGGLVVDGIYAISNSISKEIYGSEWDDKKLVQSVFGSFSLGYKNFLYIGVTGRNDWSSTLPVDHASYFYPSVSTSLIFSELTDISFLSYGKLRLNWAQVGNDAGISKLRNVYYANGTFNDAIKYEASNTVNNPELKSELTSSYEIGLELGLFKNRISTDFTYYNKRSEDLIVPASIPSATGYNYKYLNSGAVENKGVEIGLNLVPVKTKNFNWNMDLNWSRNKNVVKSTAPGVDDYVINSNGAKIVARVNEEYGIITGTDYVRDEHGNKLIYDGRYVRSKTGEIIGNVNPDWFGGLTNSFTYKNFSLKALISVRWGGDIYSYTERYGRGSGILAETIGLNELGNEQRAPISEGGGVLLNGVNAQWDANQGAYVATGERNSTRIPAYTAHAWSNPEAEFIVDGTYVKLRELSLVYRIPQKVFGKLPFKDVTFSLLGKDLFILYKKSKHFDPEVVNGVGIGGLEGGVLPSTRSVGCSLKLNF